MKIRRFAYRAFATLALAFSGASAAIWDGTADISWYKGDAQAYNLTTAEELAGLAQLVNDGTSSFEGKTITLGADIFLNDTIGAAGGTWASVPRTAWTPIGTSTHPFKGEFDGLAGANKKRKIYGLYINDSLMSYAGLFGYTDGVKISNLDMLVGRVIAQNDVGALVGRSVAGTVTNVHAEVKVKGVNHVGGLVGYTTGSLTRVSVTENVVGQDSVGGVAGLVGGDVTGTAKSKCYFIGSVSGRDWVGGIAGRMNGTLKHAYHEGGDLDGRSRVGGLAGEIGGSVLNSYSEGSATALESYAGGLAGFVGGSADSVYHIGGDVSGAQYVGGAIGELRGGIKNSYSEGSVTGSSTQVGGVVGLVAGCVDSIYHTKGNVSGTGYVGGVIGWAYGGDCHIADSYSEGDVTGSKEFVGGLVGEAYTAYRIVRSHAKGSVTSTSSYVGGVVGQAYYDIDSTVYHKGGNVTGIDYVGGVAGRAINSIYSAYHEDGDIYGRNFVGGLAGESFYNCRGTCLVYSAANSHSVGNVLGEKYVGGLIGRDSAYYNSHSYNYQTYTKSVTNSYSVGNINGTGFVGGAVGAAVYYNYYAQYIYFLMENGTKHSGDVISTGDYTGGLVGLTRGNVLASSHTNGVVSGTRYVGGLVGSGEHINDSYADCYVKGTGSFTGGIAGYLNHDINNSYHLGDVDGEGYVGGLAGRAILIRDTYAEGNVTGTANYVGGLIGEQYDTGYRVVRSHVKGAVSSTADYVGGIVGHAYGRIDSTSYHFDGNVSGRDYVGGLVGYIRNPVDSSFHKDGNVSGNSYVGGLVGYTASTIENSYATGSVTGTSFRVGGLAGQTAGVVKNSYHVDGDVSGVTYDVGGLIGRTETSVSRSYAKGSVRAEGSAVGGLVGYARAGSIINSYHTDGSVSATSFGVGGVVGYTEGSIAGSYHKGGSITGLDSVGGLGGKIVGEIYYCHSEGTVSGRNTVGGLVGYAAGTIDVSHSLVDSVAGIFQVGGLVGEAKGAVDSSYAATNVKGDDNVGGLVGSARASISNSYALGNIVGDVENSSKGNDNIGGLVGYAYGGSITKSMALGSVSGTTKIGGLVGRFEGTSISQSYAGGAVTGSYYGDPEDGEGNFYIGGLVGFGSGTINEAYASGSVKGMEVDPFMTGCLIGSVSGDMTITKSYYDATICKLGAEGMDPESEETFAEISGTPAQTTVAMQTAETFENWDFDKTWKIMEGTYPYLQMYTNSLTNAVVKTASLDGIEYDGTAKTPIVTSVTLFGETLTWETEYTIAYENNVDAGTAIINICGLSPYSGCKEVPFEIKGVAITPTIAAIESVVYTGKEIEPVLTVMNGDDVLDASSYTVSYKNNVNVGTATATITMKGNFSGTAKKTFAITKATPSIISNPTASDISLGSTLSKSTLVGGLADVEGGFAWVSPKTIPTIENEGYDVVFVPADTNNYKRTDSFIVPVTVFDKAHVVVNVGDESVVDVFVVKGEYIVLPVAPDSAGHDFGGWYNGKTAVGVAGDTLTVTEDITITGKYSVRTFAITFVNYDETVLQSGNVAYGTVPSYTGKKPVKPATAQYTYVFAGWTPELVSVVDAATYTAVYDSVVNKYTISFLGADDLELQSGDVAYGELPKYAGEVPTKAATAQYTYEFEGWSPAIAEVTEAVSYVALFDSTVKKYTVTFKDIDGTKLQTSTLAYGVVPEYTGVTPSKAATAERTYTFVGWDPVVSAVTEDVVYTAVFDSLGVSYVITFVDFDGTKLQSDKLLYGATPKYVGESLTREATVQYTYEFAGWTPAIAKVTGAETYTAVYDSVTNKYTVVFENGGIALQSEKLAYGTTPKYLDVDPTKPATAQYTYTFAGWSPAIAKVTENATYTALFDSTVNKYTVVFENEGQALQSEKLAYGTTPKYQGGTPAKLATAQYTYTFAGWSPAVAKVTEDVVYTAVFDSVDVAYTIAFVNFDGDFLQSDNLLYGATPKYVGETPTRAATALYTYTFAGWTPAITKVTMDTVYTAVYDSVVNTYVVKFTNYNGKSMQLDTLAYGSTVKYSGSTPTKPATAQYTYEFAGWSPAVTKVTKNVTYTALFDSTVNKYTVVFKNGGDTLQSAKVAYGTMPECNEEPTKAATNYYSYTFAGWSPEVSKVTDDVVYTAVFDSAKVTYVISFVNFNGAKLQSDNLLYGATPKYTGETPTRASTSQYTYKFKGWSSEITKVTKGATYTAVYDSVVNTYIVKFMDYSGKSVQADTLDYGSTVKYSGATPTKPATEAYSYRFTGWTPVVTSVKGNASYYPVFDSTIVKYAVTFKNGDKILKTINVDYGTKPTYSSTTMPTKAQTAAYSYIFAGWSPAIAPVTENVTYTAVFDSTINSYKVTFKNGDEVLESKLVLYGDTAVYVGPTPTKESNKYLDFKFAGWSPELGPVTQVTVYTAVFDTTKKGEDAIGNFDLNPQLMVSAVARNIQISGATVNTVFAIMDVQGHTIHSGRLNSANVNYEVPHAGSYLVRVGGKTLRVNVK